MSSPLQSVHIVFIPLLAQGHMIPMVDMARIFALRGAIATIYTTPVNALRVRTTIDRSSKLGMPIRLVEIPFPCEEVGLPIGFENLDILPSPELLTKFYSALGKLQEPIEKHLREQTPAPSCIISDKYIFWSSETAKKFGVPRFIFHAMCCFSVLSAHNLKQFNCSDSITSDMEPFEVPGMPKGFKITKAQLPGNSVCRQDFEVFRGKIQEAEMAAQGVVVNSFDELEHGCIEAYQKAIGKRIWSIGPVSLCNKDESDMFQRGNKASGDSEKCMAWLDSMRPRSVIYACLGSLCRLVPSQLMELGRGLGASQQPFVWVIKREEGDSELENWLMEERFEEKVKGRGIVIRGWAPQVAMLSHPAIGGFLTHCGWNSTLEGVCSALPMITWPLFSEQFVNEVLVVDILKIGVRVGVKVPVRWGEERKVGILVKADEIVRAINALVSEDEEGEERRKRAAELGEKARQAMQEGGSSHSNMSRVLQYIMAGPTQEAV
ncbi:UDP-glycosyltransferase 73D1-like [Syzygium oleosum]|uniref:UDP-glycosyltransferase 73D1-like n=1 Tax=Syzygium oleosum TaxID=219896 RepID=UPI0011D19762|nr:UDP-glycosyltransferase 73D1-like [Syzygium oleosum]